MSLELVCYCLFGAFVSYILVRGNRIRWPRISREGVDFGPLIILFAGGTAFVLMKPYDPQTALATGLAMDTIFRLLAGEIGPSVLRETHVRRFEAPSSSISNTALASSKSVEQIRKIPEIIGCEDDGTP